MSNLISLLKSGQSIWLDYIDRNLVTNGGLRELVGLGVRGVTSNPTIFEKAIINSQDYDVAIRDLIQADHTIEAEGLYHWLTLQDVQAAADILHDVYVSSAGADGYVSLEVSPHIAHDTEATISAARTLWRQVKRPNLMIKVPATDNAMLAIETLVAEGININATLLFSVEQYEAVAHAYLKGVQKNPQPKNVNSVASFFISRIDGKIDPLLDNIGTSEATELKGKTALANARLAYQRFDAITQSSEYQAQLARGANKQRLLWASTSVKNPKYPELLYVESLVGKDTINTLPRETLEAFILRGDIHSSLENELDLSRANRQLGQLETLGFDLTLIYSHLLDEGLASFTRSFDQLHAVLNNKCAEVAEDYAGA